MAKIIMRLDRKGVLDYAALGREALKELRGAMKASVNAGRQLARQLFSSKFTKRTGRLAKDARHIRTSTTARGHEVSGQVGPMPNLANIFEKGANVPARTISPKRAKALRFFNQSGEAVFVRGTTSVRGFHLAPIPTKGPTLDRMTKVGIEGIDKIIGKAADK